MIAAGFQTTIKNGVIEIPQEYKERFKNSVHVILLAEEEGSEPPNLIDQLLADPLQIPDFRPFQRNELYDR